MLEVNNCTTICYNLAPSSKLHASVFTPRGHSTLWPFEQQAVQLISGELPLSRERHMVNSTDTRTSNHQLDVTIEALQWHYKSLFVHIWHTMNVSCHTGCRVCTTSRLKEYAVLMMMMMMMANFVKLYVWQ